MRGAHHVHLVARAATSSCDALPRPRRATRGFTPAGTATVAIGCRPRRAARTMIETIQVSVDRERERARDRRRRHHEHVRRRRPCRAQRRRAARTPKRCCSSTTTSPRSANADALAGSARGCRRRSPAPPRLRPRAAPRGGPSRPATGQQRDPVTAAGSASSSPAWPSGPSIAAQRAGVLARPGPRSARAAPPGRPRVDDLEHRRAAPRSSCPSRRRPAAAGCSGCRAASASVSDLAHRASARRSSANGRRASNAAARPSSRRGQARRRAGGGARAPAHHGELQAERLVPHETSSRRAPARPTCRAGARAAARRPATASPWRGAQRVRAAGPRGRRAGRAPGVRPSSPTQERSFRGGRVDGDEPRQVGAGARAEDDELGARSSCQPAPVAAEVAGEQRPRARLQVALAVGLVEEACT